MADPPCPHMKSCEMYEIFTFSETLAVWKTRYCQSDYSRCERYQRALKGQPVPVNLLPNGHLLEK
ncbi:MAG: hypothetical protein IPM79_21145 [Polyangiaceae bacterium]|jgi:hypothetical protein|nr:hypothetical protein [Polyangiaceae bacterium]MBK8940054.1 hypothetical protein [Polyangiaceae bacterium]